MTALDNLCDVCHVNPMIGVASTSMPYSCAYCRECAERGADPELVFLCWEEDISPDQHACPDHANTYKDGRYVTYREWYEERRGIAIERQEFGPEEGE